MHVLRSYCIKFHDSAYFEILVHSLSQPYTTWDSQQFKYTFYRFCKKILPQNWQQNHVPLPLITLELYIFLPTFLHRQSWLSKVGEINVSSIGKNSYLFLFLCFSIKARFPNPKTCSIWGCLFSFRSKRSKLKAQHQHYPAPQHWKAPQH